MAFEGYIDKTERYLCWVEVIFICIFNGFILVLFLAKFNVPIEIKPVIRYKEGVNMKKFYNG